MPIYRTIEPRLGKFHVREWRRRALHTFGLLLFVLVFSTIVLAVLDQTPESAEGKLLTAFWNASNLITTLGDFSHFDARQKMFMVGAMFSTMFIGAYALSRLTGLVSSDVAMIHRENKAMKHILNKLDSHVVVIGFGSLGRLVAAHLRKSGDEVLVVEKTEHLAGEASDLGFHVVLGDAGEDDSVFHRAHIDTARALIVTTEEPDRKIAVTLMAHALNPRLKIVATGQNNQRGALLQRAGASDVVIADELIAAALLGRLAAGVTEQDK